MGTLVDVLRTPSSDVQRSVADCLGPLMAGLASDAAYVESVVARLLDMLTRGASYGDRSVRELTVHSLVSVKTPAFPHVVCGSTPADLHAGCCQLSCGGFARYG